MTNYNQGQTIVFLHIPKTAGTTLHLIIERQYNSGKIVTIHTPVENAAQISRIQKLTPTQQQQVRVIKGHTFWGWHQLLPESCAYFTLLRNPVERFISNYYFLLKKEGHPLGQKLLEEKVTIEDFVNWTGEDNYQTRFLAKNIGEGNLDIKGSECTRETLERAKRNLRENFAVVGIVEEFDKTLLLLKKTFGWKNIFYKVKNKNKQRPSNNLIPQKTLKLIKEKNKLDLELYNYATETLQTTIKNQGNSFEEEVQNFQKINDSSLGQFSALMSSSASKVQKIISFI
ncbi:MAG TPA: sulfotransferase family 2 domain-containing protein [Coleofasciculaceae cyanobacterium]|jgi:hypothetical protein